MCMGELAPRLVVPDGRCIGLVLGRALGDPLLHLTNELGRRILVFYA